MDARGVDKLLEKTFGMAETAMTVGGKTMQVALRDVRLSEAVKQKLIPLYGEEALRRTLNYAGLGLALCRAVESEMDDAVARARLGFYRAHFESIYADAREAFALEFSNSRALEPQ